MCLPEIAPTLGMASRVPELAPDIRIDPKSFLLVYRMRKLRMFRKPKFLGSLALGRYHILSAIHL